MEGDGRVDDGKAEVGFRGIENEVSEGRMSVVMTSKHRTQLQIDSMTNSEVTQISRSGIIVRDDVVFGAVLPLVGAPADVGSSCALRRPEKASFALSSSPFTTSFALDARW